MGDDRSGAVSAPLTGDPHFEAFLRQVAAATSDGDATDRGFALPPFPEGTVLGGFRLLEVVGQGGMGVVYRAHDERLKRDVALKVLPTGADGLLDEARTAAAVSSPHLASIYEAGVAEGHAYFAMELVRGASLRARISRGEASEAQRFAWALGVARALETLHRAGWLHLDVKPDNVMVDEAGQVKLLDLGLARPIASARGATRIAGTPRYMSPEQRGGLPLDARADVFAFGVLLDELGAARGVRALAQRCRADDKAQRPADGAALVEALQSAAPASRKFLALGAVGVALAAAALVFAARARPVAPAAGPSRRLTALARERPISSAALSRDGQRFAYVDDEGLHLGEVARPETLHQAELSGRPGWVQPATEGDGWEAVTTEGAQSTLWRGDAQAEHWRLVLRGGFRFASLHPDGQRVAVIEGERLEVRTLAGERSWAPPLAPQRMISSAQWSLDGHRLAFAFLQSAPEGRVRGIEIWDLEKRAKVRELRSPQLAQAYSPAVFEWGADGALWYALTDAPGEGDGAALWSLDPDVPGSEMRRAELERQSLLQLAVARDGSVLTLRQDVESTLQRATASSEGTLGEITQLTTDQLDERGGVWATDDTLWSMRFRDKVPQLVKRAAGAAALERVPASGWAQTWPTPVQGTPAVLYWAAEGRVWDPRPSWKLMRLEGEQSVAMQTPVQPREAFAGAAVPPLAAQVRCARSAPVCLLATIDAGVVTFHRLSLDGGAAPRLFALPTPEPLLQAWQPSADGTQVVVAHADATLATYDLAGHRLEARPVRNLDHVRFMALAPDGTVYLTGLAEKEPTFRIVSVSEGEERTLASSEVRLFSDIAVSADGRHVTFAQRSFDTDVWLTPAGR